MERKKFAPRRAPVHAEKQTLFLIDTFRINLAARQWAKGLREWRRQGREEEKESEQAVGLLGAAETLLNYSAARKFLSLDTFFFDY